MSARRRGPRGILVKLKRQYGLSISKETARPAMQSLVDALSSGPAYRRRRPSGAHGRGRHFNVPQIRGRISRRIAERNRRFNARFLPLGTYAGHQQGGGACDRLRFGLFRMRFNGCEVIAVYNALRWLGYDEDIRDIAYRFETNGALLLGGFGVRPDSIADYLESKTGADVRSYGPAAFSDYDSLFAGADAAVLTFWNSPDRWTIHTVMLRRLRSGKVRAFNMSPGRLYSDFDSIASLCSGPGRARVPISLILIADSGRSD